MNKLLGYSYVLAIWCSCVKSKAFINEEENERFELNPTDPPHTTLEPTRFFRDAIDFHKGFGQWHTPCWRRLAYYTTLTWEDFNIKYFPQYTSTPNWDDYGIHEWTNPPNMSLKDQLKRFNQYTAHSFEVEQYFREKDRKSWFSSQETWEKEEWRGWTTTPFFADIMEYNPNITWMDVAALARRDNYDPNKSPTHDFDYVTDPDLQAILRKQDEGGQYIPQFATPTNVPAPTLHL